MSSDIDGAIFFKEGYYYWYDLKKHVLHCMRSNLNMSSFNEAILFSGDSILIKEGCEIKKYKERDFSRKNYAKISRIAKNELFMSFSPQQR